MTKDASPQKKKTIEDALKQMEDFFSGKTPRKTPEQAKADRDDWKKKSMAEVKARNEKMPQRAAPKTRLIFQAFKSVMLSCLRFTKKAKITNTLIEIKT
jgi:hypothetical protein